MKPPVFIDTGYILALVNTADEHHRAAAASHQIKSPFITTEAVLTEIGNALARARWRGLGSRRSRFARRSQHRDRAVDARCSNAPLRCSANAWTRNGA